MEEHGADPLLLWRQQWAQLRTWFGTAGVLAHGDRPSVLAGWSVRDLVAHIGRGFLTASMVSESDDAPLTVCQYATGYAGAAVEIEADARVVAAERGVDLLRWLDQVADDAFALIDGINAPVVRGPRGPITRHDFVATRLLELVVHGDDLARSVDVGGSPLVDGAVTVVAGALADGYAEVAGRRPSSEHGIEWIRVATGRVSSDDPAAAAALTEASAGQ